MAKDLRSEHNRWNMPLLSWKGGKIVANQPWNGIPSGCGVSPQAVLGSVPLQVFLPTFLPIERREVS
ncbi:MAG: hypothetical protein ABIS50_04530 [Luteolibacter sp.]|uniref:hypothetical protein n=1 Tax=Luteolibacter sp. TaxID=1962973 RepID=UPI00326708CA